MATRRQRLVRIGLGDQWTDQIAAQNAQNIAIQRAIQAAAAQNVFQTPPKSVALRLVDGVAPAVPPPAASTGMSTGTKVALVVGGAAVLGGGLWLVLK
jgi:hypothetical protein